MPWEKSFDEDAALERAMDLFWEKGFESTSIAELLEHTGLNRGSFYNAFGDKRSLFLKALRKYDKERRRAMLAELEALDDPKRAVCELFDHIVAETIDDERRRGCFMVNAASEVVALDAEVHEILSNGFREFEGFFRRCIEVGQSRNEISKTLHPEDTARALFALGVAIRVLGRGTYTESALNVIAEQGKSLIE